MLGGRSTFCSVPKNQTIALGVAGDRRKMKLENGNKSRELCDRLTRDSPATGWKVLPETRLAAQAWVENEIPGESRQLLVSSEKPLQIHGVVNLSAQSYTEKNPKKRKKKQKKTNLQKRLERLAVLLKPPYFIVTIICVMVCIHLLVSEEVRDMLEWTPEKWRTEPWRLLTYGCIHANHLHLALNALVALAVGWRLEREQRWWRLVLLWCGGVIAGALGAGVLQPHVPVVGSSAAVYALLTAHLPNVCLRFGHIPLWWFRPLSVVVLSASEGYCALLPSVPPPQSAAAAARAPPSTHIAWSAHVLGAAAGIPLAFIVFTGENEGKRYIVIARIVSALVLLLGVIMSAIHFAHVTEEDK